MRKLALALVLGALSVLPAQAADVYNIDASHSEVSFTIRHLLSNARGRFTDFAGAINLDPKKMTSSSVTFSVKATSIDTDNADRDKHLRSADFFDVEKYPEITFKSTSIAAAGKNKYKVTGDFSMHGVTKKITLVVTFLGTAKDPWGNERAAFETGTTIQRKDYAINWNKALDNGGVLLGEEVTVSINLESVKAKPEAKQ